MCTDRVGTASQPVFRRQKQPHESSRVGVQMIELCPELDQLKSTFMANGGGGNKDMTDIKSPIKDHRV